jgi:N-terminal domain of anti-restriction factor ArdC
MNQELTFSSALNQALTLPGSIMEAYSAFHPYSIGNQLLALIQCQLRGIQPGPIKTFRAWQRHNRFVKKGERALTLCMPITYQRRSAKQDLAPGEIETDETFATSFVFKPRWFVLSQTHGEDFPLPATPEWNAEIALANLGITRVPFTDTDGNKQGYATGHDIAINPVAQLPNKTLLHETGHVVLGHTLEHTFVDSEQTPRNLREVEAEGVALVCCEALGFEGAEFCRGYIQSWLKTDSIPEASAKKILGAAQRILAAGRSDSEKAELN